MKYLVHTVGAGMLMGALHETESLMLRIIFMAAAAWASFNAGAMAEREKAR